MLIKWVKKKKTPNIYVVVFVFFKPQYFLSVSPNSVIMSFIFIYPQLSQWMNQSNWPTDQFREGCVRPSVSPPLGLVLARTKRWMAVFSEFVPEGSSLPWYNLKEGLCVSVYDQSGLISEWTEEKLQNHLFWCMSESMGNPLPRSFLESKEGYTEICVWNRQTTSSLFPPLGDQRNTLEENLFFLYILHENESVRLLCDKTYNLALLAGGSLQFSPLILLADHSHVCKCWMSKANKLRISNIADDWKEVGVERFLLGFISVPSAHRGSVRIFEHVGFKPRRKRQW